MTKETETLFDARRWRVATAVVVLAWLGGWIPSIIYSWRVGGGPQFYAVWIILGPIALFWAAGALYGIVSLCRWAFGRPSHEEIAKRIDRLERELNMRV